MFKNEMVKSLIELQKKGVKVHLTQEGVQHFLSLMKEGFEDVNVPFGWSEVG